MPNSTQSNGTAEGKNFLCQVLTVPNFWIVNVDFWYSGFLPNMKVNATLDVMGDQYCFYLLPIHPFVFGR